MEKINQAHGKAHTQWLIRENKHAEEGKPSSACWFKCACVAYALLLQFQVGIGTFSCFFKLVGYQTQCLIVQLKEGH